METSRENSAFLGRIIQDAWRLVSLKREIDIPLSGEICVHLDIETMVITARTIRKRAFENFVFQAGIGCAVNAYENPNETFS